MVLNATGFKLPLATYLVQPEAELSVKRGVVMGAVEPRSGKVGADRLALAGNRSARWGFGVRPKAGREEA